MNWIPILAVLAFTCAAADLDSIKADLRGVAEELLSLAEMR